MAVTHRDRAFHGVSDLVGGYMVGAEGAEPDGGHDGARIEPAFRYKVRVYTAGGLDHSLLVACRKMRAEVNSQWGGCSRLRNVRRTLRPRDLLRFTLALAALPALAQDTRHVTEPRIPSSSASRAPSNGPGAHKAERDPHVKHLTAAEAAQYETARYLGRNPR